MPRSLLAPTCSLLLIVTLTAACGGGNEDQQATATSTIGSGQEASSPTTSPTAQAEPTADTPQATATLSSPASPTLAPTETPAGPTPTRPIGEWGNAEIYVMNADGTGQTRLTNMPSSDVSPVWSPDGSMLAFVRYENYEGGLYVMNADGTDQRRLSNASGFWPAWSPDGRWIATSGTDTDVQYEQIFIIAVDGSGEQRLTSFENVPTATLSMGNRDPAWSPDGQRIAFVADQVDGPSEIHIMNPDGSDVQRLTDFPGRKSRPVWSPDGAQIVFGTDFPEPDIWLMNADGTGVVNLTQSEAVELSPVWTADGSQIVFIRQTDEGNQIVTIGADGSDEQAIADGLTYLDGVMLAPDGQQITFSQGDPMGDSAIYRMNLDGSDLTRLTDAPHANNFPTWSPDGAQIAFVSNRDGGQPVECNWSVIGDLAPPSSIEAHIWMSYVIASGTIVEEHAPAFGSPAFHEQSPDPTIYTDYTLQIERQFRGNPLDTLRLRIHGGTIGDCAQDSTPEPELAEGMRVLLLLGPETEDTVLTPAYFPSVVGTWNVITDDTLATPDWSFAYSFNPEGVDGLSLDDFAALVATTLAGEPPDDAFMPVSLDESPATPE